MAPKPSPGLTAMDRARAIGIDCEDCVQETLMNMSIHSGVLTPVPVYRQQEFYRKLEDQVWLHNSALLGERGIQ